MISAVKGSIASPPDIPVIKLRSGSLSASPKTPSPSISPATEELVLTMAETGAKSETLVYNIPLQDESGLYTYDEEGNLKYSEAELVITRRDTGEYVINCDQIIYLIDMFSPASKEHILGTDGDGFAASTAETEHRQSDSDKW